MTWEKLLPMLWEGTLDTLYMTFWSSLIAYVIGLPLGVLLVVTRKDGIMPSPTFNTVLGVVINFLRSIPFIIMLAVLFPVTRAVIGTAIGTKSIVFPLIISAFPYIARMVEGSLDEVDHGIIEAAQSMGSTNWQIITKVLLPEATPSLISGATITVGTILGYGAMAGIIGGGGLGQMAITYGYYNTKYLIMWAAVIGLIILVQIFQSVGGRLAVKCDKRLRNKS